MRGQDPRPYRHRLLLCHWQGNNNFVWEHYPVIVLCKLFLSDARYDGRHDDGRTKRLGDDVVRTRTYVRVALYFVLSHTNDLRNSGHRWRYYDEQKVT